MTYEGLIFSFNDLLLECETLKDYAKDVLDRRNITILRDIKSNLEDIKKNRPVDKLTKWQIPEDRPLLTIWSENESQPGNKSAHTLRGEFSFVWEIRPLNEAKLGSRTHFLLNGKASTLIQITNKDGECLARWTVDIGDGASPGAHCHFQLGGFNQPPFPKSLDIPRLPAFLMSPFQAIEIAIGELFQDRWKLLAKSLNPSAAAQRWRAIQRRRFESFLRWQLGCLKDDRYCSPWMDLKLEKPPLRLLIIENKP